MDLRSFNLRRVLAVLGLALCSFANAQSTAAADKPAGIGLPGLPPKTKAKTGAANTETPATPASSAVTAKAPPAAGSEPGPIATTAAPEKPAPTPAVALPVVITTPVSAPDPGKEDRYFPRYAELKPAVAFWRRVFGELSDTQSIVHSATYPYKVLATLDLSDEAERMNRIAFAKRRELEEKRAKEETVELLKQVHKLRETPSAMNSEQRRLYDQFADIKDDDRFRKAADTVRVQHGLKERTEQALETSSRYLPVMETTFKNYQLPVSLTRLPLVESSFNIEAYSKAGAAGLWQFIPSSARIYMRLNELVDDRRDPWTSTDAAARHLKDDYAALGDWPLAITAYNYGRSGISRALNNVNGTTLVDLIERFESERFGFASKNYYAEFLGALEVDRDYRKRIGQLPEREPLLFDVVETKHYVPYETLRQLCGADDELFRKLNPAYRPEVIEGKMYVPPDHLIRIPAGRAKSFEVGYEKLSENEKFDAQRVYYLLHKITRGDNIGKLAHHYGVTQASIIAANGLGENKKKLRIGQVLKIPPHVEQRPGPISVAVGESVPAQTRAQRKAEQAEAERGYHVHKVTAGQTLGGIAKQYKVSLAALRGANKLDENSRIKPGMKLRIPPSG